MRLLPDGHEFRWTDRQGRPTSVLEEVCQRVTGTCYVPFVVSLILVVQLLAACGVHR